MILRWLFIFVLAVFIWASLDGIRFSEPEPNTAPMAEEEVNEEIPTETEVETEAETDTTIPVETETTEEGTAAEEVEAEKEAPATEEVTEISKEAAWTESGIASHYGTALNGSGTASGATLDTDAFQAAHKTLAFGTQVKVSLAADLSKSVVVEIVDRGPYVEGRVIDLTPAAFEELAPLSRGVVEVILEEVAS